jgi:c-di-GMP-binding flagellar brake protein YcgR
MPAFATGIQESRTSARVRTPGWADVESAGSVMRSDRLYDISQAGIALFLDIQLPRRQEYRLRLTVYHNGKVHGLNLSAQCVYATLAGINGFRHGFQFSSVDDASREELAQVLA